MITRRFLLQSAAAAAAYSAQGFRAARAENAPGVTDTEIKIGQTMPYSGPLSAYGVIGRTEAAYFKMINEQGGVNGRKITLISLDDAYSPPTDRRASAPAGRVGKCRVSRQLPWHADERGDPSISQRQQSAAAVRRNRRPDVRRSAALSLDDGLCPNYQTEAHIYAKHILATKPDAKIAVLYQNDCFGKDYLIGLREVCSRRGPCRHDRQGRLLRDFRAHGRFAGGDAAGFRRRRVPDRRFAEVRRPGDPQILRSRAGRAALLDQCLAVDCDRVEARRPREVEGPHHRHLRQRRERPALEGRSGGQEVEAVHGQIHVADRVRRQQRRRRASGRLPQWSRCSSNAGTTSPATTS